MIIWALAVSFRLKIEAGGFFETSTNIHQNARRHISEDCTLSSKSQTW